MLNITFRTVCTLQSHLRVCAKFCCDWLTVVENFRFPIRWQSAILNFQNVHFPFHTVYGHNLSVFAKIRRDRLNGWGDITNFLFSIWRLSAILNFLSMQIFTFHVVRNGNLHVPAKISCRSVERLRSYY